MSSDSRAARPSSRCIAACARIVPFGGFEMPVQYAGILAEHAAVRQRAAFDLSHMAQFEVRGEAAAAWLDDLTVTRSPR